MVLEGAVAQLCLAGAASPHRGPTVSCRVPQQAAARRAAGTTLGGALKARGMRRSARVLQARQGAGRASLATSTLQASEQRNSARVFLAAQSNLAAPSAPPLPLPQSQRAPTWEALPVAYPAVYRPQGPAGAQGAPAPAQARPRQASAVCPCAAGATRGAEGRCRGLAGAVAVGRPADVRGAC